MYFNTLSFWCQNVQNTCGSERKWSHFYICERKISAVVFGHVFLPLWTNTVTVNLLKGQGGDENPVTQVREVNLQ